jgi:hypothetical protein
MWGDTVEGKVYDILNEEYGNTNQPIDVETKGVKLEAALDSYEELSISFKENPSSDNWNLMIIAMSTLQYWTQKRVPRGDDK